MPTFRQTAIHSRLTLLTLGLLFASAFFLRFYNSQSIVPLRTIDEIVYKRMAEQVLKDGWSGYQIKRYGVELKSAGRDLPDYFSDPIFKHPPVFTFCLTLSMKLLGITEFSVVLTSLILGCLLIPLIYWLGCLLDSPRTGFWAAILMWLDPVSTICSQKVWMDTSIAFWSLLSVVFLVHGIKNQKTGFWWLSAFAMSLGVNTKYTVLLTWFAILIFVSTYHQNLFRSRKFVVISVVPLLSLLPWVYWNWQVYGFSTFLNHFGRHRGLTGIGEIIRLSFLIILLGGIATMFIFRFRVQKKQNSTALQEPSELKNFLKRYSPFFSIFFIVLFMFPYIFRALQFGEMPSTSWQTGFFSNEPPIFYFGRMLEFNLLYGAGYFYLFRFHQDRASMMPLVRMNFFLVLLFFIAWGGMQSRYILSAIPMLILCTVVQGRSIWRWLGEKPLGVKFAGQAVFVAILCYSFAKTMMVNLAVSFPNNMCYF